jgi:hypothetical protein
MEGRGWRVSCFNYRGVRSRHTLPLHAPRPVAAMLGTAIPSQSTPISASMRIRDDAFLRVREESGPI